MHNKFTVRDKIVGDSLKSIETYRASSGHYKPVIGGGIANQIYAYPHFPTLLRPTHDVDVVVSPRLTSDAFRQDVGRGITRTLGQYYSPEVNVLRHVYEVKTEDPEGDLFFIHSYRWTVNGWERERKTVERQVSDANHVSIPNSDGVVHIVRPEEIIVGKVQRLRKLEGKGKIPHDFNGNYRAVKGREWGVLASSDFDQWLSSLVHQKDRLPASYDRGKEEFQKALDAYVGSKDLFDIALISRLASDRKIDFDEKYYDGILQGTE